MKTLSPDQLDERSDSGKSLDLWLGRKVELHFGSSGILVRHKTRKFAVRAQVHCNQGCGRRRTVYAVSGLHNGAWCYIYDRHGNYLANMRDDVYNCGRHKKR